MTKKAAANNYAFIDSQNLNLGTQKQGWDVDYKRFRQYLRDKDSAKKAFLFIGFVENNQKLYSHLQSCGFILIFKPTISYLKDGVETRKGNVDAELVLWASAVEYANYDQAVIVSGDGDFACLMQFLEERNKLLRILAPTVKYSQLLQPYVDKVLVISKLRRMLEYKKRETASAVGRNLRLSR